jgi:hypothetical protein
MGAASWRLETWLRSGSIMDAMAHDLIVGNHHTHMSNHMNFFLGTHLTLAFGHNNGNGDEMRIQ